jgi:hypothetical protein
MSLCSYVGAVIYQGFAMDYSETYYRSRPVPHLRTPSSPARPSNLNTITVNCRLYVRNLCDQTLLQSDRYELLEMHPSAHHTGLAFLSARWRTALTVFWNLLTCKRGGTSRKVEREFTRSTRIARRLELARLKTTSSRTGF